MSALHTMTDPLRSSRRVWGGICWIASLLMAVFGGVYLVAGIRGALVKGSFEALTRYLPGGMHTYGVILLVPALATIHGLLLGAHRGLTMRVGYLRETMLLQMVVAFSAVSVFVLSWVLSGVPTWGSITVWSAVGALGALVYFNPPPRRAA